MRGATNYNRSMSMDTFSSAAECLHSRPQPIAAAIVGDFALLPISVSDLRLEYCLRLAHQNMSPYLERRGEQFNDVRWRQLAPHAEFYLIKDDTRATVESVGFLSVRRDPDCSTALHIGDVQVEAVYQNRGAGSVALNWIESLARSRALTEITLNVFRDNPALRLYERFGFCAVDTQFYKYKMRKTLLP